MHSDSLDMDNWETLRTYEDGGPFSIERTRKSWVNNCENKVDYRNVAAKVVDLLKDNGWKKVTSLGVGKGILEYHLKKMMPTLEVVCTDYTKSSLEALSKLFVECSRFQTFDMLQDDYSLLKESDVVIIYRLSTEFTKEQWKDLFSKMYVSRVENIIFIPTELLSIRICIDEKVRYFLNVLQHRRNTFCGWMYTRKEFLKIFKGNDVLTPSYCVVKSISYEDTEIFELKRCERSEDK